MLRRCDAVRAGHSPIGVESRSVRATGESTASVPDASTEVGDEHRERPRTQQLGVVGAAV